MRPTSPAREFLRMAARGHARRLAAEKAKAKAKKLAETVAFRKEQAA